MPSPAIVRRLAATLAILGLALAARAVWLTADPPTSDQAGIVWHDEGAWTHNARNKALSGVWRTDEWNPIFIAPVFTALEYGSFVSFGVGTWQARVVPVASGLIAIAALMLGVAAIANWRAALIAGLLLATNFTFVMWNRAALMESTMTMWITVAWAAYAMAERRPWLGVVAGTAAVAAFFTKAAAAFFIAALGIEVLTALWLWRSSTSSSPHLLISPSPHLLISSSPHLPTSPSPNLPIYTASGVLLSALLVGAFFVLPHWTEFQFYNWQMTVTRKPTYGLSDLIERTTWLPIAHGVFSRMWPVLALAAVAAVSVVARWSRAQAAERLAVLWLGVGLLELIVHDAGNERRYVMFIPVLIALASLQMGRWGDAEMRRWVVAEVGRWPSGNMGRWHASALAIAAAGLAYIVIASGLRMVWLEEVLARDYRATVRVSALLALGTGLAAWVRHTRVVPLLSSWRLPAVGAAIVVALSVAVDAWLYTRWAESRTFLNFKASRMLGALLPPGTLVHGKLANGLAFENRIAPIFIGRGFGNYEDRLSRDDARYILSYTAPEPGYEGPVILDVLGHYPQRQLVVEFDVQETPGVDRAALIDKFPNGPEPRARDK